MNQMNYLRIGDTAPNFRANTQLGEMDLYEFLGESWGVFCSHPEDMTPVCTTELGRLAQLVPEFTKRDCKVMALSCDSAENHKLWISDINETQKYVIDLYHIR